MTQHPTQPPDAGTAGTPVVIGWREWVALPEWGVKRIKAKVDTGARTSAIDVEHIEELPGECVRFHIVVSRKSERKPVEVEAPIVRRTRVKSSFGDLHDRLIVSTRIRVGPVEKDLELSLVSREGMLCRMLLGREALAPEFLVDSSRRYVMRRRPV